MVRIWSIIRLSRVKEIEMIGYRIEILDGLMRYEDGVVRDFTKEMPRQGINNYGDVLHARGLVDPQIDTYGLEYRFAFTLVGYGRVGLAVIDAIKADGREYEVIEYDIDPTDIIYKDDDQVVFVDWIAEFKEESDEKS
jgi:hypothetical protein